MVAKAKEPEEGSLALQAMFNAVFGMLPLGLPLAKDLAAHFLEEWWKAIIARFSGKPEAAEEAIKAMVALNEAHLAARDASEVRQHEETMAWIDVVRRGIDAQQRSAEQFAAPVGPAVTSATLYLALDRSVSLNVEEADAIREAGKLDWGPLEPLVLRTDGFRFHTSGLSIENPEREGFLMARVRDPRFAEPENPYTEAAQQMATIRVLGRRGYRGAVLMGIEIVDLVEVLAA